MRAVTERRHRCACATISKSFIPSFLINVESQISFDLLLVRGKLKAFVLKDCLQHLVERLRELPRTTVNAGVSSVTFLSIPSLACFIGVEWSGVFQPENKDQRDDQDVFSARAPSPNPGKSTTATTAP